MKIYSAVKITDQSLRKLSQLKMLSITDCTAVKDDGICHLIKNSINLELLETTRCKNLTKRNISEAFYHAKATMENKKNKLIIYFNTY